MFKKATLILALLALGLGAARSACGAALQYDPAPGSVLFIIETHGGVASPLQKLTTLPDFVLYGDGTAIWTRYDHRKDLRVVWTATLTPEEVRDQLDWIQSRGYMSWYDRYDEATLPDLPATAFTLHLAGRTVKRVVYGLQYSLQQKLAPAGFGEILDRYRRFSHAGEKPYLIDHIKLFARRLTKLEAKRGARVLGWGVKQVKLADFARDSETDYGETDLTGKDAQRVIHRLKEWTLFSTDLSVIFFKEKREDYQVGYRPVLPGE